MPKILTSWEIIAHIDVSVTGDIRLLCQSDFETNSTQRF